MTKFEVIMIHTIAAVFLISQHLVSSSDQCYNGTVKVIPADDSGSCKLNVSTHQLLNVRHFRCAQDEEKLLLFILSQGNNSVTCECDSCCDAGFQVDLCENNTWEALCNMYYTQYNTCHHNDCVKSTSMAMNPSSVTVTVTSGNENITDKECELERTSMSMSTLIWNVPIGLLTVLLIVVTIVAITICNRMRKQNKSLTREIQEYEMISKYSAVRHDSNSLPERYSAIKKRDSNRKQPILPPAHLAADYLTPTRTKTTGSIENPETNSDTKKNQEENFNTDESKNLDSEAKEETKKNETCNKDSDENPYQSLIVPMANATSVTIDGYVKIIRSRVGSLEGQETPAPKTPPIPPKPEPDYSLKSSIPQLSLASELPPMSENMYASRSGTL